MAVRGMAGKGARRFELNIPGKRGELRRISFEIRDVHARIPVFSRAREGTARVDLRFWGKSAWGCVTIPPIL